MHEKFSDLSLFSKLQVSLPGLRLYGTDAFREELKHSRAQERLNKSIRSRVKPTDRPNANDSSWDPRLAIVQWDLLGNKEEATWLAFLTTVFSTGNKKDPWASIRDFYSGFHEMHLTWAAVCTNPLLIDQLRQRHASAFGHLRFGNHRKHEKEEELGTVIASYVRLVRRESGGSQTEMFLGDGRITKPSFGDLMRLLDQGVYRFGRLASFDLLCLLGNLEIFPLTPDRLYLDGSTGPLRGAILLFGPGQADELDKRACQLATELGVSLQVMEDTLCNWQKHIRG